LVNIFNDHILMKNVIPLLNGSTNSHTISRYTVDVMLMEYCSFHIKSRSGLFKQHRIMTTIELRKKILVSKYLYFLKAVEYSFNL